MTQSINVFFLKSVKLAVPSSEKGVVLIFSTVTIVVVVDGRRSSFDSRRLETIFNRLEPSGTVGPPLPGPLPVTC